MGYWRLGHRPGLDGLRGIAILLVVVAHLGIVGLQPLGWAGVTVFFTLSGFLITSLLLAESDRTQTISMRSFYARRLRRLGPAFALMMAVVVPLGFVIDGQSPHWWAPILEVSNWYAINEELGYLHHTWSLSIEEQFYLVWPVTLLFVGNRFGRRGVAVVAGAGIAASVGSSLLHGPGMRMVFGGDTNAAAMLAGCLLAVAMVGRPIATAPRVALPVALLVGMVSIVAGQMPQHLLLPICTAVAIWSASTRPDTALAWTPLRGAGRISYGWYLWNFPVMALLMRAGESMLWAPVISLGIALLSWRLVEKPILRGRSAHSGDAAKELVGGDVADGRPGVSGQEPYVRRGERGQRDHRRAEEPVDTVR